MLEVIIYICKDLFLALKLVHNHQYLSSSRLRYIVTDLPYFDIFLAFVYNSYSISICIPLETSLYLDIIMCNFIEESLVNLTEDPQTFLDYLIATCINFHFFHSSLSFPAILKIALPLVSLQFFILSHVFYS